MSWFEAAAGPPPCLAERIAYWEGLEAAFLAHAPAGLRWGAAPTARPPAPHAACERWLPLELVREELSWLLQSWFDPAGPAPERAGRLELVLRPGSGEAPGPWAAGRCVLDLATSSLGWARSWLDLRGQLELPGERLPSALYRRLATEDGAAALLSELWAGPRLGRGLTRYPERRALLCEHAPAGPLRLWDAGCAAGETTWALARDLARGGRAVSALGTTPWPLELLQAARRSFPHDPTRSAAYAELAAELPPGSSVRFELGDLARDPAPGGPCELVVCHGVLGGSLRPSPELFERLSGPLAPGGLLSVTDDFRSDRHSEALAAAARLLADWDELAPGLWRRL